MKNQEVIDYLIENHSHLEHLIKPILDVRHQALRNHDHHFHYILLDQYNKIILSTVSFDVCENISCTLEEFYDIMDEETTNKYIGFILENYYNKLKD